MKESSLAVVFSEVLRKLETEKVPYMVVGSIAVLVYGEPRLTKDMDLVVDLPSGFLKTIPTLFPADDYYCPPEEVLSDEFVRRGQFNIVHPASGLKIDFVFRKTTLHAITEFDRRRKIELWPGLEVSVAAPEDVILKKLDYYREGESQKHLRDIRGILAATEIDLTYLQSWVEKLQLAKEWELAQNG